MQHPWEGATLKTAINIRLSVKKCTICCGIEVVVRQRAQKKEAGARKSELPYPTPWVLLLALSTHRLDL